MEESEHYEFLTNKNSVFKPGRLIDASKAIVGASCKLIRQCLGYEMIEETYSALITLFLRICAKPTKCTLRGEQSLLEVLCVVVVL